MKLYFRSSNGNERIIAEPKDEQEVWKEIHKFCSDRNFKIHYVRQWQEGNRRWYDYGSWSEFFVLDLA